MILSRRRKKKWLRIDHGGEAKVEGLDKENLVPSGGRKL